MYPQDGSGFSAYNFFQYLISLIVVVVFTAECKIVMKAPWRNPETADLVTGRRKFSDRDIAELDHYYGLSRWQRFCTYVKLW